MNNKPDKEQQERLFAFHEAGHTVIQYILGYEFLTTSITEEGGFTKRSPLTMAQEAGKKSFPAFEIDEIKILLSGGTALFYLAPDMNPYYFGLDSDVQKALWFAKNIKKTDEEANKLVSDLQRQSDQLVKEKKNWLAISNLAEVLIKRKVFPTMRRKK